MQKQTVEVVEAAISEQKVEIIRIERIANILFIFFAGTMNDVTTLRNEYQDFGEWDDDEDYGEYAGGDDF